jgi:putative membrane protein
MCRSAVITLALLLTHPSAAWADAGVATEPPVTPGTLWRAWNCDPFILLNLILLGSLYLHGMRQLWGKAGGGRGVARGQAAAYLGSLFALVVALISPLHALSEELASAHMVQHMLLMVIAAPLFVLGSPGLVLTWALAPTWRPATASWHRFFNSELLVRSLFPGALYAAALWVWHLPVAYEAALVDPLVHDAQHLSFFAAACLFWRALLDPLPRRRLQPLTAVVVLFTTSLHAMLLGVFMALSPGLWYEAYAARTDVWGLTPLEDQQLAGLIMWMPACLVYPAVAAAVIGNWLTTLATVGHRSGPQPIQGA